MTDYELTEEDLIALSNDAYDDDYYDYEELDPDDWLFKKTYYICG